MVRSYIINKEGRRCGEERRAMTEDFFVDGRELATRVPRHLEESVQQLEGEHRWIKICTRRGRGARRRSSMEKAMETQEQTKPALEKHK